MTLLLLSTHMCVKSISGWIVPGCSGFRVYAAALLQLTRAAEEMRVTLWAGALGGAAAHLLQHAAQLVQLS